MKKSNYLKTMVIGTVIICLSLNGFSQKCVKFIDYQNKTVNTKGISMQLPGGLSSVSLGETSVSTLQREASDKLQTLDLLQHNICEQLKNIKNDFIREKLQTQYSNLLMKMMNLIKPTGNNTSLAQSNPEATPTLQTRSQVGENNAVVPEFEEIAETVAPLTQPSTGNNQTTALTTSIDEDIEVDISFPCGDFSISTKGIIRAFGMETSMDAQIAKRAARTVALEELASKIEIIVKTVTEDYFLRTQKNLTEEFEKRLESKTQTIVNQTLTGYTTACEKFTQNKSTKKYSCYTALEISEENVLKPVYQELQQDPELKNVLPNYERFSQTFNEVMDTYEKSF